MKITVLFFLFSIIFQITFAQAPLGFSFQTIIRDSEGKVQKNQAVSLRFSILEGSETGTNVYSEMHSKTTNDFGVLNLTVGTGTPASGSFSSIVWGGNIHFLKTEIDPSGGITYSISTVSQLMSVPYAMYAQRADTALKVPDVSPTNEIQVLSINNDTIYLSDGGYAKLPPKEKQKLSVSPYGDTLYISDGNYAIVPGITLANQLVWNKTYRGISIVEANSIQQTSDGGYIVAGSSDSSDGDITDGNNGGSDFCILKLNPDGTKEWDKTFGGSGNEGAWSVQQTIDGGYIIAGDSKSSDGDISDGNNGERDIWILKLNPDGTKEWDKTYGGLNDDWARCIQQTTDGGYVIAGTTYSSDGDITGGNKGNDDFWILKLNSNGTKEWDKTYGGSDRDYAYNIQQTNDEGYIVAASTQSSDGDITDGYNGGRDIWILKLNSDGTKAWDKTYGGSSYEAFGFIQQTNDEGYIVSGGTLSSDGDVTDGNNGGTDIWILKLNSDGTKAWDKTYGGSDSEYAASILQTIDGGYIMAGSTESYDGDISDVNNGIEDFWLLKLNPDGSLAWDKTYGGSGWDRAEHILQTSDGGYILVGNEYFFTDLLIFKLNNNGD